MAWMAIFYALLYAYSPLQTILKSAQITRPIFVANALAFLAMFTIGLWAIQRWGVYGTIAGQTLNALIVTIILWATWIRVKSRR
jgi:Na+-driven multidrug efflux pump